MKKLIIVCMITGLFLCGLAFADSAQPYADTIFTRTTVNLKTTRHVSFSFVTTSPQSSIYVQSVYLYHLDDNGTWQYTCKLPTPTRVEYNTSSFGCDEDYSAYISSGTYRIQYTAVAGGHAITRNSNSRAFP